MIVLIRYLVTEYPKDIFDIVIYVVKKYLNEVAINVTIKNE